MTKSLASIALVAIAGAAATPVATAEIFTVTVLLSGLEEVPPTGSPGTGSADVTIDTVTRFVQVSGQFSGLIGTVTAGHIHGLAAPGSTAGVIFGFTVPVGASSGSFSGSGIMSVAQFDGLMNNLTYLNIHSTVNPGGEIRGQVIVPAPAGLLALTVLPFAARRRRA